MSLQPADDNAHRKGARLIVRYRHRPHYGESVELLRRDASSSSVRLVVRLPDGSPLTLQDWMTRPEAELFPTVLQPAIAPRVLAHLHDIVSDFLLSVDTRPSRVPRLVHGSVLLRLLVSLMCRLSTLRRRG